MAANMMYRAQKTIERRVIDASELEQPTAPRKLAVFVTHGMGQQMPLETLSSTADGLVDHMESQAKVQLRVRTISMAGQLLSRVEIDSRDRDGQPVELHVYEGYWADLTENKVSLRDVMGFLYGGAINGLKGPLSYFERYVFGRAVRYKLPWHARLLLLYVTGVITFFVGINLLAALSVVQLSTPGMNGAIPFLRGVMPDFERILAVYLSFSLLVGACIALSLNLRPRMRRPSHSRAWRQFTQLSQWLTTLWYAVTLASFLLMVGLVIDNVLHPPTVRPQPQRDGFLPRNLLAAMWALVALLTWFVRGKLVQFVGDVAVYVSTPKLNRFLGLRREIQARAADAARTIYSMRNERGNFEYEGIGLMGHSLGSVVIYDTLNALLLHDELHPQEKLDVAERTRILLTFGSPLDKTAFIFAQQAVETAGTKGALSAAMQPLIQDYEKYRTMPWINVHSPRDIIAGDLDFYDDPEHPLSGERHVQNIKDPDALIPIAAHIEHWMNPLIYKLMLEHLHLAQPEMAL